MHPATGRIGTAAFEAQAGTPTYRLQLDPGETIFLQGVAVRDKGRGPVAPWLYHDAAGEAVTLTGAWSVEFVEGGPELPKSFAMQSGPTPWTESTDPATQAFAGMARYTHRFDLPGNAKAWRLDLGEVMGSAVVRINDNPPATLVGPSFAMRLDGLRQRDNVLEVELTSVAANRIRDLDRRGVKWRIFDDINFVNIAYRKFDASKWPVKPLGLAGPVTLTPLD